MDTNTDNLDIHIHISIGSRGGQEDFGEEDGGITEETARHEVE